MVKSVKNTGLLYLLLLIVLSIQACKSRHERLKESGNHEEKYNKAVFYFNEGRERMINNTKGSYRYFHKSRDLYEALLVSYKGTNKAEDVSYGLAYSTYYLGSDLMEARFLFKNLADDFPNGKYAEDARFMVAKCFYEESPMSYSLDQTNTYKALEAIQLFMELYPNSDKLEECNNMVDLLRLKLEEKSFQNAKLYLTTENYQSAIIAFKNSLRDFPDSKYREEIEFLIIKSSYLYAKHSIRQRQEERYENTLDAYRSFIETFPDSRFTKEASDIFKYTEASLVLLKEEANQHKEQHKRPFESTSAHE